MGAFCLFFDSAAVTRSESGEKEGRQHRALGLRLTQAGGYFPGKVCCGSASANDKLLVVSKESDHNRSNWRVPELPLRDKVTSLVVQ